MVGFFFFSPPFPPGGSVRFLRGPDRFGPLHREAGEGRRPDPGPFVPQPREEGPGGRDRRLRPGERCPGPLLRHQEAGRRRRQGGLGERAEGRGRREGQPLCAPSSVYKCIKCMLLVLL